MISFARREQAQRAAACVGVDAGKFSHTLVVRPRGAADSKPIVVRTNRDSFEAAHAQIQRAAGLPPTKYSSASNSRATMASPLLTS